ncbi:putative DMT superfamily transporter inner membrane protein [Tsuneonella dongtanensis]|uniref:Putative DMT superfamily transporter inner membrane protein n=1 Tax=Tsuneonella dongtanensis TaxID=692370 RepID=A0A1B2AGH1_9SPHN|nr:EamA family transporter RarD [Tsuneonella dongtanensis]ANY21247.1 putative DMT superfamily transporter inner membrane protein [Tsuneonella dongtanensis]
MNETPSTRPNGLPQALGAYLIWGFLPLYLILVASVPPVEFVAWRIVWTVPLCLAIAAFRSQLGEIASALKDPGARLWLAVSAVLIGLNWLVYIWAIQAGEVLAASLGYYINPLVNVLLGTLILGERLSRRQWIAVALAAAGVALLLGGALTTLWISLTLALSFGTYGLVRKRVAVGALPGLTVETLILILPALGIVAWYAASPAGSAFGQDIGLSLAIVVGGVVTAIPLWLFAEAARRMDYSLLGFIQFLAPTIVFVLGLTVFDEPLTAIELGSFVLIWMAVGVFVWDLWSRRAAAS